MIRSFSSLSFSVLRFSDGLCYTVGMNCFFTVSNEFEGRTASDYLSRMLGLSRHQIASLKFRPEGLKVNGVRCRVNTVLHAGDLLALSLKESGSAKLEPDAALLDILYEDAHILAVNKPSGLVFHPSPGHYADSLANRLAAYAAARGESWAVRPAGRLDQDTSGAAVFAKSAEAAALLSRPGAVKKTYLAVVSGVPDPSAGSIVFPIGPDPAVSGKMCVCADGKPAGTFYQTAASDGSRALLSIQLEHGRTHQIRVHLSHIGHPLLGDPLYGTGIKGRTHAMLHCRRAEILLPFSGEKITVEAPLPPDWESAMKDFPDLT